MAITSGPRSPDSGPQILILGHFDTVWDLGQIDRMPVREADGRLYGPGIFDMKAGLTVALLAIRATQAFPVRRRRTWWSCSRRTKRWAAARRVS